MSSSRPSGHLDDRPTEFWFLSASLFAATIWSITVVGRPKDVSMAWTVDWTASSVVCSTVCGLDWAGVMALTYVSNALT